MTDPRAATTTEETPVFFPADGETVFGVLTEPSAQLVGRAVITVPGAWLGTSMGPNRLLVRLSRRLAALGFHALRFDFHGIGESTGPTPTITLDDTFVEDLEGAIGWAERRGMTSPILVGVCLGGRTVLDLAPRPDMGPVALISPPVRDGRTGGRSLARVNLWHVVRGLRLWMIADLLVRDRRRYYWKFLRAKWRAYAARLRGQRPFEQTEDLSWVSRRFLDPLEELVEHGVPVLLIYGTEDDHYVDFEAARAGRLGQILDRAGDRVQVVVLPGEIHSLSRIDLQEQVIGLLCDWACRSVSVPPLTSAFEGG